MKVETFLENLCLGDLSNLYIGLEGQVELHPQNRRKLFSYINQGLVALHSRFALLKKEVIIRGLEGVSLYEFDKKRSIAYGTKAPLYIDDTVCEPFDNDFIKVLSVHNDIGVEFPLNNKDLNGSLYTPSWNTLQIPHAIQGAGYFVIYQAKAPVLVDETDNCDEINIPPHLEEALQSFVASKVYSHMNGRENKVTAQEFMAIFEGKCIEVTTQDQASESEVSDVDLTGQRGFV